MNNIGKRVRIKNYLNDLNGRIGTITSLNTFGVTYTVQFNDGKLPNDCIPYIETHLYAQCELIEEEFVLPAKWMVIRDSSNAEVLNKWNNDKYSAGRNDAYRTDYGVMYSDKHYSIMSPDNNYTEITFEQFKQYVLKENKTNMEKKIIGYKLVKPEYNKQAVSIMECGNPHWNGLLEGKLITEEGINGGITDHPEYLINLTKAGVLDLWFSPVYENLQEIKVGDFFMCTEEICSRNGKLNKLYKCIKTSENQIFYESHSSIAKERCKKATAEEIKKFTFVDIKGYQAIMKNGMIEFGCQSFSKKFFLVYIIYSKEMLLHLNVILITQN